MSNIVLKDRQLIEALYNYDVKDNTEACFVYLSFILRCEYTKRLTNMDFSNNKFATIHTTVTDMLNSLTSYRDIMSKGETIPVIELPTIEYRTLYDFLVTNMGYSYNFIAALMYLRIVVKDIYILSHGPDTKSHHYRKRIDQTMGFVAIFISNFIKETI